MLHPAKATTVATINNTPIVVIENGEKRVAVKPICEALGIAFEPQFTRLKTDPILSSVVTLSVTTGSDGKQYEMVTIPFKFVFGWLFRIDSRNVKEEARASVLKYQLECYEALYEHFNSYAEFVTLRSEMLEEAMAVKNAVRVEFVTAKDRLKDAEDAIKEALQYNYQSYLEGKRQLTIEFKNEATEGGS